MASLFRQLLGDTLDRAPVRALHEARYPHRFEGRALVRAADGMIARWLANRTGLPSQSVETPIAVTIEPDAESGGEIWTREFPTHTDALVPREAGSRERPPKPMRTRMRRDGELLLESFGPIELRFRLVADADGIVWQPVSFSSTASGGAISSGAILRGIHAREFVRDGRYAFDVGARLPLIGHVVAYDGWLHVD
jgi:hypothetical protein